MLSVCAQDSLAVALVEDGLVPLGGRDGGTPPVEGVVVEPAWADEVGVC